MPTRSRSKTVPAKRASATTAKAVKPAKVVKATQAAPLRATTKPVAPATPAAQRTRQSIRSAAERAVQQVLNSREAFALMMRALEEKGWRIERAPGEGDTPLERGEL